MQKLDKIFLEDESRSQLAKNGLIEKLKLTYHEQNQAIENPNSPRFWDQKLNESRLEDIDSVTKDKLNTAIKLLPKNVKSLLDIGVGQGYFLRQVFRKKSKINTFGVDISLKGLRRAKKSIRGKYLMGSILSLPFKKEFDAISVFEVFEHIPHQLIFTALKEVKKCLRKRGVLLASVPINENYSSDYNPNRHLRRYSKELFLAELELSGFKVLKVKEFYAFDSFYFLKKFLSKHFLTKRWNPNNVLVKAVAKK